MKKQSGSAHAVIIIILVITLIGALGFIFWQNFLAKNSELENSQSQKTSQKEEVATEDLEDEQSIPDGYAKYEDKKSGFSFAYPKEWGELSSSTVKQRPDFGIGSFGNKLKSVSDSKGTERIAVYTEDSFFIRLASGYEVRYRAGKPMGSDAGTETSRPIDPIVNTDVYSNDYGDSGFMAYDLHFKAGASVIYVNIGDSKDSQRQIASTVQVN